MCQSMFHPNPEECLKLLQLKTKFKNDIIYYYYIIDSYILGNFKLIHIFQEILYPSISFCKRYTYDDFIDADLLNRLVQLLVFPNF